MKMLSSAELVQRTTPVLMNDRDVYHEPFNPSKEQRSNLTKLATYLYALPDNYEKFNMEYWSRNKDGGQIYNVNMASSCGTVACAAGHGPAIGIAPLKGESWYSYVPRVFGCGATFPDNICYKFMFAGSWEKTDNTPRGAALRIFYALQHGIPANTFRQIKGTDPLCYR